MTQASISSSVPSLDRPMMIHCPLKTPSKQLEYRQDKHCIEFASYSKININSGTDDACSVSWSAFHASQTDTTVPGSQITTSSLLPLFPEDAATVAVIKHSLDIFKK